MIIIGDNFLTRNGSYKVIITLRHVQRSISIVSETVRINADRYYNNDSISRVRILL